MDDNNKGKGVLEPSDRDMHMWTEKERRKKFRDLFHQLHGLLPHLPPKVDSCTLLDEATAYIKNLQQKIKDLEEKKRERLSSNTSSVIFAPQLTPITRESSLADFVSLSGQLAIAQPPNSTPLSFPGSTPTMFQSWSSSNVTLSVCGPNAHINVCSFPKLELLTMICIALERHNLEIVSVLISSNECKSMFMIHARANAGNLFDGIVTYEEVFKQATTEIMLCVDSDLS